jgi:hypothetical protein
MDLVVGLVGFKKEVLGLDKEVFVEKEPGIVFV